LRFLFPFIMFAFPLHFLSARQLLPVSLALQALALDLRLESEPSVPYLSIAYSGLIGCERTGNTVKLTYFNSSIRAFKTAVLLSASEEASHQLFSQLFPLCQIDKSRNLAVFLNPVSGRKQGNRLWQLLLQPLLTIAGLSYAVYTTTGPHSLPTLLHTLDIARVTDIVCIGGDGLVHQVLNCVRGRDVRVGVVPAGSQNALACALGCKSPSAACFHILKGNTVQGKVLDLTLDTGEKVLACCGVAWGIVSSIAKQAEHMRQFGPAVSTTKRYAVSALGLLLSHWNRYSACLQIKPSPTSPWEALSGPFTLLAATKHSCPSSLSSEILFPAGSVQDQQVCLVALRACSRLRTLQFLGKLRVRGS